MRAIVLGFAATVIAGQALAADYLRGSTYEVVKPAYRWDGFYFGGQAGYAYSDATFERTPSFDGVLPAEWPELPSASASNTSYGAFFGYNAQFGEIVIGAEANYSHVSLRNHSSRRFAPFDYTGTTKVTDYGTFRFRAGYAWDWVMPYASVGLALVRADVRRATELPSGPDMVDFRGGVVSVGYSVGVGVDVALMHNLFVRGEYEFMQFKGINGSWVNLGTARGAVAVKF